MVKQLFLPIIFLTLITLTSCGQTTQKPTETIVKIEMHLSAFGVKSDDFPSIDAILDFPKDSSKCIKSFYNPEFKGSTYSLSNTEMSEILKFIKVSDLKKLKSAYTVGKTDQPSSKTTIYTNKGKYTFDDYGLVREYPLSELYKIVYKL